MQTALIETAELAVKLQTPKPPVVLDVSWYMPASGRDAKAEFMEQHIPTARFFDIDSIADTSSPYPHSLPSAAQFSAQVTALGISKENDIVFYDAAGLFSAARGWWMFRVFGHDPSKLYVLNGGLPKWLAEGRSVESGKAKQEAAALAYEAQKQTALYMTADALCDALPTKSHCVLDARGADRFYGKVPEPREGVRSGHIPGSFNVPYASLLDAPHQTMKTKSELEKILIPYLQETKPVVATCGSGVTACIIALACYELARDDVAIFDGSWSEWGSRHELPVAV
jgi:thiosulfate/3-mercaptopyruvate sulfurtransferase